MNELPKNSAAHDRICHTLVLILDQMHRRVLTMRKYELYPEYRDLFEYLGNTEIQRIRIRGGEPIRQDWFVFETVDDAIVFFS